MYFLLAILLCLVYLFSWIFFFEEILFLDLEIVYFQFNAIIKSHGHKSALLKLIQQKEIVGDLFNQLRLASQRREHFRPSQVNIIFIMKFKHAGPFWVIIKFVYIAMYFLVNRSYKYGWFWIDREHAKTTNCHAKIGWKNRTNVGGWWWALQQEV